ncbi:MAG TPA: hypothetical protein ENJ22_01925 [Gammaproteobacteria bacterium]|nr:hypothetical protein [Gammaproteobacteria bacterium]
MMAAAQIVALGEGETLTDKRSGWLPYAFATDSLGTAAGFAAYTAGTIQPQASLIGTAFVSSNKSAFLSGILNGLRLGKSSRFFLDSLFLISHFTDQRFYAGPAILPGESPPGTNDSHEEAYITGVSNEITFDLNLKYRLALGGLKGDPLAVYQLKEGLLISGPRGGEAWSPQQSGQTTLGLRFFYTYRDLNDIVFNQIRNTPVDVLVSAKTNGLEFWLEYDNTDFPRNPSRGSKQVLNVYRDFGWLDSDASWTNLQMSLSKYFDLGSSARLRQNVVALNFWTSDSPGWNRKNNEVEHRPPPQYGSELGGYDRLRAYPSGRFHDKAAIYYGAEWRLMSHFQPLGKLPLLSYFDLDWWQLAPFAEAGRVGSGYDSSLFFRDLKWDVGIGLRLMVMRSVVRLDFAYGGEGAAVWAMFGQPFARQAR